MKKSTTIKDDPLYLLKGRRQFPDYEKLCDQIDKQGFIPVRDEEGKMIKIYSPWIIDLILPEKVQVIKIETGAEEFVNGFDYLKDYIEGYHEGMKYFDKEIRISQDTFYRSEKYIPDLQYNYFISKQDEHGYSKGWESIKNSVDPMVFNHASIRNFGYKSGIVRGVEEEKEKYPVSFKDFEKFDNVIEAPEEKNTGFPRLKHLLSIPTKARPDEILNFWLRLRGNNEKGQPYWKSKDEIKHFVNQNFEGFSGVREIKRDFNPNMNKLQLKHTTWIFYDKWGETNSKIQYENLLRENFTKFKKDKDIYGNIKDQFNKQLDKLLK